MDMIFFFGNFYKSILELTEKFDQPLSEAALVELLKKLLADIRYELLYANVHFVAHLCVVRRNGNMFRDIRCRRPISKLLIFLKKVFEFSQSLTPDSEEL